MCQPCNTGCTIDRMMIQHGDRCRTAGVAVRALGSAHHAEHDGDFIGAILNPRLPGRIPVSMRVTLRHSRSLAVPVPAASASWHALRRPFGGPSCGLRDPNPTRLAGGRWRAEMSTATRFPQTPRRGVAGCREWSAGAAPAVRVAERRQTRTITGRSLY